jgi:Ni2+-binding GTPase involved in maturation of urease and hydrogenase
MEKDTEKFRKPGTFFFTNLMTGEGVDKVVNWIKRECLLTED